MSRVATLKPHVKSHGMEPILTGLVGGAIGFFINYLGSMVAFNLDTHPIHWLAAFIGAVLGVLIGRFYAYWRNRKTS
jgi:H+/Cl- antiporter ClcA